MGHYGNDLQYLTGMFSYTPVPRTKIASSSYKEGDGHSDHGHPIPNNEGWGEIIFTEISRAYHSGETYLYKPRINGPKHIIDEVYRFYLALLAYYEAPNPVIPVNYLLNLIRKEKEGIIWLKRIRSCAMVQFFGGYFEEYTPELREFFQEAKRYKLSDLGDFFNVRYWLFFDQPDEHDWEAAFIPLPYIPTSRYDHFEEVVLSLLPDTLVDVIQEEEILLDISGSSSRLGDKNVPLWYSKQTENYFSNQPLRGKGSYVQKCPGDTRFSIVLSAPQSNSVKLIEKQVAKIAEDVSWSCYVKDNEEYFKRYFKLRDENVIFYCRDVKKDGLTKNRELVRRVLSAIKTKYPYLPMNKYTGIFDNFYITIDGVERNPPRGVGLGMSAAITTIIQAAIFRINLDKLYQTYQVGSVDALFYHDDAAVGATHPDTLEDFKDIDYETCLEFGIPASKPKCFTGDGFVLCENYSDEIFDSKVSYQMTLLKMIHASENVSHAKHQFLSLYRYTDPLYWKDYLEEIIDHFGYEFYPEEASAPTLLGGWVPATYQKMDISLWSHTEFPTLDEQAASLVGLQPIKHYPGKRRFSKEPYLPVAKKLFPAVTNFGKDGIFLNNMTCDEVANSFTRLNKIGLVGYYWKTQLRLRRKKFYSLKEQGFLEMRPWYRALRRLHPTLDIYPPPMLTKQVEVDQYPEVERLYKPSNPRLQYLRALNMGALSDKILPYGVPPDVTLNSTLSLTAFERSKVQFESHFFSRWTQDFREMNIAIPTNRAIYSREWFNPMANVSFNLAVGGREVLTVFEDREDLSVFPNEDLFYRLNHPSFSSMLSDLTSRLGYTKVKSLELTYFAKEINQIIRLKQALLIKEAYNKVIKDAITYLEKEDKGSDEELSEVSNFTHTDAPLEDGDFFTWRTSKRNYLDWRNHYFIMLDEKLNYIEIVRSGVFNTFEELDAERCAITDPVCRHLYLASGGALDDQDIPIVDREHVSASYETDEDVFKNSDRGAASQSGSSEIGLMEGW
jgi:hypothetical protein